MADIPELYAIVSKRLKRMNVKHRSNWLYAVWEPRELGTQPIMVQHPGNPLDHIKKEVKEINHFELAMEAIEQFAGMEVE